MHARFRDQIRQARAALRQRLGFAAAEGRDLDLEQARIRLVIGLGLLLYAVYVVLAGEQITPRLKLVMAVASCPMLAGAWMVVWFRRNKRRPVAMRYFAICADLIPLTVGLWGADEAGVPLLGIYLWVTVGNGFRFGSRYLMFSYWVSCVCFGILLVSVPFWRAHSAMGIGIAMILATIPLYVLVLLSRLNAQKDAALELSSAKSRFVANVSHELRTPLTGVFAVYDLLRRRRMPPEERELVGSLGNAIGTLKTAVDAILQMSKLEAGAERAERRLFNLHYFLHQLSALVKPQAAAKQLGWSLDIDVEVPHTVVGDPSHLQHVLGNLVNNAFKFTPKGGVTLRVTAIGGVTRFEVTDTGIGIPLDQQEKLFDRFVQADGSATRKFGGTGLGTSIAHDLVKLMGGKIGVCSAPGHGSTFWFELPFNATTSVSLVSLPPPAELRDVIVIARPGSPCTWLCEMLVSLGYRAEAHSPSYDRPPPMAANRYLAAVVALPALEAASYLDAVLRERVGITCPWLVVADGATPRERAALLKGGADGVVSTTLPPEDWRRLLAALAARIALQNSDDEAAPLRSQRKLRVLLADDNASNRLLLARILSDAGHGVTPVARGDEAYDVMASGEIDLALLDLNMPEMSGLDATKLYRAGEAGGTVRLPIIILSADATGVSREESLAAGASDYITKPVAASVLLATIERVTAASPARSDSNAAVPVQPPPQVRREAPPEGTPVLVDLDRLEALQRIANRDRSFINHYFNAAFDDLEAALAEVREAVEQGNSRVARDALHKIDGTGASIGATALLAAAKNTRNYVTGPMDSDAAAALAELATTCALTKSAARALIHDVHTASRPR